MNNIHIGEIIKEKFVERKISASDFASRINHARSTVYDIFNRKSIDIDLLLKISEVLEYDFISEIYVQSLSPTIPSPRKYYLAVEMDEEQFLRIEDSEMMRFNGKLLKKK